MLIRHRWLLIALAACCWPAPAALAQAAGTAFTFQGQLQSGSAPASGTYDIQFRLYDAATAGSQIGGTLCQDNVPVMNGLFTVTLDFGFAYPGAARWLEVAVRPDTTVGNCAGGGLTVLSPRQQLTSAPYAAGLTLPESLAVATPGAAFTVTNSGGDAFNGYATGTGRSGVYGATPSSDGFGVFGRNTSSGAFGFLGGDLEGVLGENDNPGGRGGWFATYSPTGEGVFGQANATTGLCYGVFGSSGSSAGIGVFGQTLAGSGNVGGVKGVSFGANGNGVIGEADNGTTATGVVGVSQTGWGVEGLSNATTGETYGVFGQVLSPGGVGVYGTSVGGVGVSGVSDSNVAVSGSSNNGNGVSGQSFTNDGIVGQSMGSGKSGVYGFTNLADGFGVSGWNWGGGTNGALGSGTAGVYGATYAAANAPPSFGVRGDCFSNTGYAGYFVGRGYFSDNVGINVLQPSVPLQVAGGTDLTLADGGNIVVGQIGSANLVMDNNEIQARGNGAAASLFINASGGNVGIGTNNTQGFQLAVNGSAAKPGGGSWSTLSDARLKKDIRPIEGALGTLLALHGVTFEYLDPKGINELPGTRIGMVAQEVEKVMPDWVEKGPDGMRRVTFRGFEALTVEGLRDLKAHGDAQAAALRADTERRLAEKDAQIAELRSRMDKLEALVAAMSAGPTSPSTRDKE